jgi:predicted aldo/keto reductase-like oxidoreductase
MQYRNDKKGNPISILGFGCMRFTRNGPKIDLDKAEKELMHAIDNGVNYLDTAYIYPGSEVAVGELLKRNNCRDKVLIATKLPHYMIKSLEGMEKTFKEQLRRLQTDHIDYYLIHMLNDVATWNKLVQLGIGNWIKEKVASGQIRQIGFSFHGNTNNFIKLIDAYSWDFCQIQYNYLDEYAQAGVKGLKYAAEKHLPIIIMEPLRGGRLVNQLPEAAKELIKNDPKKRTAAELAFRWLWNQPEVTCVLSGMNSTEMVEENLATASTVLANEFTDEDFRLIEGIVAQIKHNTKVGCTGCGYCMPCPKGVDIPMVFHCYNLSSDKKSGVKQEYLQSTAMRREQNSISQCVGCGKCEQHCPQGISIRAELKNAAKVLETPSYKFVKWMVKVLKLY